MKGSTILLILLIVIEVLIIGGAILAITQIRAGNWDAGSQPDELLRRIGTVAGILAPVFGVMMGALYLAARAQEKKKNA